MKTSVKVSSFLEAFNKFLSYSDGSIDINTLSSFSKLKEDKKIEFHNETQYWCGNHHSSNSQVELFLVEEPVLFYVVKFHYSEMSDRSNSYTETSVFVAE